MSGYGFLIDYAWCTGCHTCEVACQMEHGLPPEQFGIKVAEVGPWEYGEGKWQYTYLPVPTDQCDLCADRRAEGKLPTCVHHCQAQCLKFGKVEELMGVFDPKGKQALIQP
jgi:anaerobic dimethyl sulfoxide reductase subunit B (iron-sulfur subunit)